MDANTAFSTGLAKVTSAGRIKLNVDSTNIVPDAATGRNTVRMRSKKTWHTGLFVADVAHIPEVCVRHTLLLKSMEMISKTS